MHGVFDQQAAAGPDAVAIECGEQRWTYAEIAAASRCFAADLQRAGVRPGAIVGIGIGRSVEFVVAVLAVLRCGAAYAPLPIDDPVDRLASMVDSAGVTAIVTAGDGEACSPLLRARPGLVRLPLGRCRTDPRLNRLEDGEGPACDPEDPAYVMFTSGSTGTPKGVVVPHRAVVGLVIGQTYADFGPELRTFDGGPVQRVLSIDWVLVPWSVEPGVDETGMEAALRAHARMPVDLATAPLWRATLFPAAAPHGVLLLIFHHAIIDDWSIDVCLADLGRATRSGRGQELLDCRADGDPRRGPLARGDWSR